MSKFLKWIVNIVLIVAIVVACGLLIPPLVGITTVTVDDVDKATNLERGSVTYGISKGISELTVGDDVIVIDGEGENVYRLKDIDVASGKCELEDIKSTDGKTKSETFTNPIPKVLFTVPFIGYVVMAMKSTEGLIIIGLGVIFVIILFILSELWKKDKDEEDEDEDEEEQVPATPVDMSAHILEKVSSEIGSEISNVIAQDTDKVGEAEAAEKVVESEDKDALGDTVPIVADIKEAAADKVEAAEEEVTDKAADVEELADKAEEAKEEVTDKAADVEEVADEAEEAKEEVTDKAADVEEVADEAEEAKEEVTDEADNAKEEVAKPEEAEEPIEVEEPEEDLEPVEMAMPTHTAAELIQRAREIGLEPEIEKDEDFGVTIIDYSKLL